MNEKAVAHRRFRAARVSKRACALLYPLPHGRGSVSLALLVFLAGCGYISNPAPPLANIPNRISDLAAVQRGSNILVHFSVPTITTENHPIAKSLKLDLRIGQPGDHFQVEYWANDARPIQPSAIENAIANYKIPVADWSGKLVAIGARTVGSNGKPSNWSNIETVQVVAPPETPSRPTIDPTPIGEHIAWTGKGDQFRVMRRAADEKDFGIANTLAGHEWTDTAIEYGKTYTYMVQSLDNTGTPKQAESDLSAPVDVTPVDTFPPAVPAGLHADRAGNGVALVWEPDSDSDLAGYRVYRAEGDGAWQKIAGVNTVPAYTDTTAEHGKTYRYAVTAFDKAVPKENESERCAPVEVVVP